MKDSIVLFALLISPLLGGCNEASRSSEAFAQTRFENVALQEAYAAAQATMEEYSRVDQSSSRPGLLRSVPTMIPTSYDNRPLGKPLSTPPKTRQIAEISVEPVGKAVLVGCSVLVQRSEVTSQPSYAPQYTGVDSPGRTPLKEDEGMAREGGEIWGRATYDRKLAREMLAAIEERLTRADPAEPRP